MIWAFISCEWFFISLGVHTHGHTHSTHIHTGHKCAYRLPRQKQFQETRYLPAYKKACIYVYNYFKYDSSYLIVGINIKNMASHFFAPPQHASQYTLPEKLTKMHWLHYNAKQKHLSHKKVQGQSKATYVANRHVRPKTLISTKAKKLLSQNYF